MWPTRVMVDIQGAGRHRGILKVRLREVNTLPKATQLRLSV